MPMRLGCDGAVGLLGLVVILLGAAVAAAVFLAHFRRAIR